MDEKIASLCTPRDPYMERAAEAMERLRSQLARGIRLPPKLMIETTPSIRPLWIGIDWAKPE